MSSRYYVARPGCSAWSGVCEVPDDSNGDWYYHHTEWPTRSDRVLRFIGGTLAMCLDKETGWWDPMLDEDMLMDEGL